MDDNGNGRRWLTSPAALATPTWPRPEWPGVKDARIRADDLDDDDFFDDEDDEDLGDFDDDLDDDFDGDIDDLDDNLNDDLDEEPAEGPDEDL